MVFVPCNASPIDRRGERLRVKLAAMRLYLILALAVAACGGAGVSGTASPPSAQVFAAARWVPANPTYVVAATSLREGQRAVRDLIDSFGMLGDLDSKAASAGLAYLLGVDPLQPESVAGLGIDVDGGIAIFSEDLNPTFVAHLAAPEQLQTFFDQQRQHGLVTSSVMLEGTEVFSTKLGDGIHVSWAVDNDWFWLHFTFLGASDETAWFANSHRPGGNAWMQHWTWAQTFAAHARSVVGYFDLRGLLAKVAGRVPQVIACAKLVQPIGGVALAVDGDLQHASARLAFDLGPSAKTVGANLLLPPPGWGELAVRAPISVQSNLDLQVVADWAAPCGDVLGIDLRSVKTTGVRTARALLKTYDPSDRSAGTGAVSLDVTSAAYFAKLNDKVDFPGRSFFDKHRKFGPYDGHRLSPPTFPTLDYVLGDRIVLLGVGEGLLDKVVTGAGPVSPPPIISIDVYPPGLSQAAWEDLFGLSQLGHPKLLAERLLGWREGHIKLVIDGDALVLQADGNRR
ncbi:MAG: hypothetical protein JWO36_3390 [Myxococcales bacterium]|nr:hypothetical protein [Myxococcales bacterium]